MADILIFRSLGFPHEKGLASLAEVLVNIGFSVELVTSAKNYSRLTDEQKIFQGDLCQKPTLRCAFCVSGSKILCLLFTTQFQSEARL